MTDKEKSLINSKDNVDREDNVIIPNIVVSSYLESGENLTGGSGSVSIEKDNVTETSDLKTSKSVLHDKSELKRVKLSRANRAKKESKSKSSIQSWQKTFVKKQSERQIKKDKVLSRLIETSVEANNSQKQSAIPKKTPNLESKTKTPNLVPKTKTNSQASQKPSEAVPPRIKADINDVKKEQVESEKDGKIKKIEKSKEESPKRIKGFQDKPDENREKDVKLKKDGDKKENDDPIKAKLAEILRKQKEKLEVRNAPSKRHLKVHRGKVISKKSTETTMETKRLQKNEDSTEIREEHVSSHDSFKKRQQYGDDLRKRIRKKSNLDESNTRVVFNQTFGRRKESVNNIQTLVKEEKKAKRQVSFSSSGLPKYSSSLAHFDKDNSFARFHESSNVSSMKSGKVGEKLSAVVKPMPSRNATTSQSAGMENQRHRVIRSPTFTKEAPEVLQFNRNRHTGIQRHLGKDDYRQNARPLDSKLKYKPHIHRRSDTNESVHLYTEVNVPVKKEYQRNFDSFVLLDKNFEDAENTGENSTPEQTIYKTQRRWTQNTIETKSVPEISSRKSSRKLSLKSETNSKYSTTPMLEIVFQPDKGDVYVSESKEQTKVYIKSGKVSAFLHRSPSAPTDVPSGEKDIVRRSKSEIPVYSDDEYEVYPAQRPHTDTYREYPPFVMGRYEQSNMNSEINDKAVVHRTTDRRGKRVSFFRNGDKDFKGVNVCINPKQFLNFEALLVYLNDRIETSSGVRYVFSLPDGKEIKSVTAFQQGRSYLVSSVKKPALDVPYGQSRENFWNNKKPSAGRVRKEELELFKRTESPKNNPKNKPRVITVINNEYRDRREKFYINPSTRHNFEDLLLTMGDMTNIDIHALFTEKQPHRKVESFSQLFNEFKNQDNFIACGPELVPLKPENVKRPAPSSNSGSDSMSVASRMKKFHKTNDGDLDEINEYEMQRSPSPQEHLLNGVPVNGYHEPLSSRHYPEDDSVKFNIRGKVREYFPPSITYPDDDGQRPDKKLKLEWIYGFHAREGCKNLVVFKTGELLYYVAAVAVFFRRIEERGEGRDTQRHYLGHTEDISCLTLHPTENWVASGQVSGKENPAHVRIWDGEKLTTFHVIGIGFFSQGVASIGFSEQSRGGFMCVTDTSDKHVLSVWDWEKERMIAKTTTTTKAVNCCCFYKYDDTLLITYGADHLFFWRLFWDPVGVQDGKLYRDKLSGVFEEDTQPAMVTSHAFSSTGDVITGDSNGSILVWTKDQDYVFKINKDMIGGMKAAHMKPVSTLCMMVDNTLLSGGGSYIKSWDSINNYRKISKREIPEIAGNVRTIIPQRGSGADGQIYVGTSKSCILAGSLPVKFRFIVQGHCKEIWAIAAVPGESSFITTSHDQFVIKWSAITHRVLWRSPMEKPTTALAVDSRGLYVAVGSVAGRFFVLNAKNGMHIITVQVGKSQINAMRYSPDNAMLAVGCEDGHIHIFYVHDEGQIYRKNNIILRGHMKFVTNLDWSTDSRFLQSVDGDFELHNWNIQRMEREDARTLRDCNWQTYSCCAGHPLMGPWTSCDAGETVSVVARSNYREIIITGDNTGRMKVFKYPSSTNMPACRWTKLYSGTVTALEFLYDDSFVLSSAGKTPVLAQWSVVDTYSGQQNHS